MQVGRVSAGTGYLVTIADYFDFEVILCLTFKAVFTFLFDFTKSIQSKNSLSRKIASKYCRHSVLIARKFLVVSSDS